MASKTICLSLREGIIKTKTSIYVVKQIETLEAVENLIWRIKELLEYS